MNKVNKFKIPMDSIKVDVYRYFYLLLNNIQTDNKICYYNNRD